MCAYGTGLYYVYEGYGTTTRTATEVPIMYQFVPLADAYLGVNEQGLYDTCCRRYFMTARQTVQQFGDAVHAKVKAMANNKDDQDRAVEIIHAVWPREQYWKGEGARGMAFGSWYVDVENKHMMREGGRRRFPYIVMNWNRDSYQPYGESPLMLALAEIKSLQVMQRSALQGVQQMTRPPLLMSSDGLMNRPNLNAGAVNMGGVDQNGRPRIMPLVTSQFSTAVVQIMEGQKNSVKELLYANLWQILIQNPQMTATEALIRAQEKGDLLSPVGLRIQSALSDLIDLEFDIYMEKAAFMPGSPLAPPQSLEGKALQVEYASPLDKLRRASEVQGINDVLAMATQIAAVDPTVLDEVDFRAALDVVREVRGAPAKIMRSDKEVAAIRQEKAQAAAAAGAANLGVEAGQAMKNVGEGAMALKQAQDMIMPQPA
jgi:Bacteriophage head to tail connecting protein